MGSTAMNVHVEFSCGHIFSPSPAYIARNGMLGYLSNGKSASLLLAAEPS